MYCVNVYHRIYCDGKMMDLKGASAPFEPLSILRVYKAGVGNHREKI